MCKLNYKSGYIIFPWLVLTKSLNKCHISRYYLYMMQFDEIFLFRISSAFTVLGISLVFFLLGGLSKERSSYLFGLLHSFSAGIMLGMGFLFDDPDGIAHMNHESTYSAVYIASISFLFMLAVEYFNATSTYDYSAVMTVDDTDHDSYEGHIELSKTTHGLIAGEEDEFGLDEPVSEREQSLTTQLTSKSFKFHPLILLFFASASDMIGGMHLSCEEHYSVSLLLVVLTHKALMSCAFGTLLESSTEPRSVFLYFMMTFSLSTTIGILTGTILSKSGHVTAKLLRSTSLTDLKITALTAGVYLYIACMKMIPAGLLTDSSTLTSSSSSSGSSSDMQGREKIIKFGVFLLGFVCTVLPKLLLPDTVVV